MTPNARAVYDFLKEKCEGNDLTPKDVAIGAGVSVPAVTATFNNFVKKDLGYRDVVTTQDENEKDVTVKYFRLNPAFYTFNPDA